MSSTNDSDELNKIKDTLEEELDKLLIFFRDQILKDKNDINNTSNLHHYDDIESGYGTGSGSSTNISTNTNTNTNMMDSEIKNNSSIINDESISSSHTIQKRSMPLKPPKPKKITKLITVTKTENCDVNNHVEHDIMVEPNNNTSVLGMILDEMNQEKNVNQMKCLYCNETFRDTISMNDHILIIHEKAFDDQETETKSRISENTQNDDYTPNTHEPIVNRHPQYAPRFQINPNGDSDSDSDSDSEIEQELELIHEIKLRLQSVNDINNNNNNNNEVEKIIVDNNRHTFDTNNYNNPPASVIRQRVYHKLHPHIQNTQNTQNIQNIQMKKPIHKQVRNTSLTPNQSLLESLMSDNNYNSNSEQTANTIVEKSNTNTSTSTLAESLDSADIEKSKNGFLIEQKEHPVLLSVPHINIQLPPVSISSISRSHSYISYPPSSLIPDMFHYEKEKEKEKQKQNYDKNEDEMNEMNEMNEIDNIQTNEKGRYVCFVCNRKYLTEYMLGTHFMITHSQYNTMLSLDAKKNKDGYPGLYILRHINMIYMLDNMRRNKLLEAKSECQVCFEIYRIQKNTKKTENVKDDIDTHIHNKDKKNEFIFNDDTFIGTTRSHVSINDERILEVVYKYRDATILPVFMTCCDEHICSICFEKTIKEQQNLKCPYCYYDHTQYDNDNDYVFVYDINTDKKSWIKWWSRNDHLDILF